jgi:2-hydroxy-3-oxopropionate reductase
MANLGFIGLGIMGAPMARNLQNGGHQLFVHTRTRSSDDPLEGKASYCESAAEVATHADVIFIMVPDTPDVEKVLFADAGVASGLTKGKVVVDMSSIAPFDTKRFAQRISELDCDYLDAPVSGGEVGAKAASLTIMVGGTEAAFARVKPFFELMGKNITHVGDSGAGQT